MCVSVLLCMCVSVDWPRFTSPLDTHVYPANTLHTSSATKTSERLTGHAFLCALERVDVQLLFHHCCGVPWPQCWKTSTVCIFSVSLHLCMQECVCVCVPCCGELWPRQQHFPHMPWTLVSVYFLCLRWNLVPLRHSRGLWHFAILLHALDAVWLQNDKWKTGCILGLFTEDISIQYHWDHRVGVCPFGFTARVLFVTRHGFCVKYGCFSVWFSL